MGTDFFIVVGGSPFVVGVAIESYKLRSKVISRDREL